MKISNALVVDLLNSSGVVPEEQLKVLESEVEAEKGSLQAAVVEQGLISEKRLTQLYADYADIPFIELDPKQIPNEVLNEIPKRIARKYNAVLFKIDDDGVRHLAMEDPDDVQAIDFLKKNTGSNFKIYIATEESILQALENYSAGVADELNKVIEVQKEEDTAKEQQVSAEEISEDSPIAQTVNLILEYAIRSEASDIHIEPRENYVQIRYRIDGILKEANRVPKNVMNALVSRIKILSNLKIDERRVPQDGRFKVTVAGRQYAFRVSTLPVTDGEKIVMRILSENSRALTLEELGYWGKSLSDINQAIVEPNGMILVTGPTGSGKSTSLFSVLSLLNDPTVNISTVEDPVEYKIEGANQTQVNPKAGMTFAAGLRALLRQDPNIIMVGEIRDGETANLGVQAALTGHLVFSTLHTNNAATCLPRLLDMGIEPFLIASTVRVVVGQRLVRRLCFVCREKYTPSREELTEIREVFDLDDKEIEHLHKLETVAASEGLGLVTEETDDQEIEPGKQPTPETSASSPSGASPTEVPVAAPLTTLYRPHSGGCDKCNNSGYRGRMGIYEVLSNSVTLQKMIVSNATSDTIQDQAITEGMVTMQTDGIIKAMRGLTSIEEIIRVTRE